MIYSYFGFYYHRDTVCLAAWISKLKTGGKLVFNPGIGPLAWATEEVKKRHPSIRIERIASPSGEKTLAVVITRTR
ncbi:MAG: hypothetical protein J4215_01840 [Candidatus Diapherotrites archaeon]|uniref:Uncharacterized protein n=1 Tax=Candidatus Iainarchaeum sp. TaxID=3101447 RepID=A0A8T4L3D3_9ARCH|nr:hypothetical protein [Candidatus Diapherotrites archaeon]